MFKFTLCAVALSTLGILSGCSADAGDGVTESADGTDPSQEEAAATARRAPKPELATGTFKLFEDPQSTIGTCVTYTELKITRTLNGVRGTAGYSAHLENRVSNFGTDVACRLAIAPMPRDYALSFKGTSCGSNEWTGSASGASIAITDHAKRTCRDSVPSKLVVKEKRSGSETTLYAAEPSSVFEGTFIASQGIGGENSGASLQVGNQFFELILSDAQRNQFADGLVARVTGLRTLLSGIETRNRQAIKVQDMLVCPEPGATLNCQPRVNARLSNLCSSENVSWVQSKCAKVLVTF